ncbi:MAG: hypothetical protein WCL50_09130, partial [Spirochaetota bacterium]
MKRALVAGIAAAALLAVAVSLVFEIGQEGELQVADGEGIVMARLDLPDGRFDHVYTHSVHRSPVMERFRLVPGGGKG